MDHELPTKLAADAVGAAQRRLPPELRALARGVAVHYERKPRADVIDEGFPPDILGLFTGAAHGTELAPTISLPLKFCSTWRIFGNSPKAPRTCSGRKSNARISMSSAIIWDGMKTTSRPAASIEQGLGASGMGTRRNRRFPTGIAFV